MSEQLTVAEIDAAIDRLWASPRTGCMPHFVHPRYRDWRPAQRDDAIFEWVRCGNCGTHVPLVPPQVPA